MRGLIGSFCGGALCFALAGPIFAGAALAQTANPLANPMFAAPSVPPGMVNLQDNVASPYISPAEQIHGYVSTGVSTNGGRGVEGGAIIPILPGTASLEVGGGTGQFGVRLPKVDGGTKKATISTDSYYATLHVHPTADVDVDISVSGDKLHLPGQGFAAQRLAGGP